MPHLIDFGNNGSIVSAMSEGIYDDVPEESPAGSSRRRLFSLRRRAELITSATRSPAENRRSRERIYLIIQLARVPILALSALALFWWDNWPIALLLFAISIPLPAVAVVIANESREKPDKRTASVYKPGLMRELEQQQRLAAARQAELEQAPEPADEGPETIDLDEDPPRTDPK